jgi:hypothetical protein
MNAKKNQTTKNNIPCGIEIASPGIDDIQGVINVFKAGR